MSLEPAEETLAEFAPGYPDPVPRASRWLARRGWPDHRRRHDPPDR